MIGCRERNFLAFNAQYIYYTQPEDSDVVTRQKWEVVSCLCGDHIAILIGVVDTFLVCKHFSTHVQN